MTQTLEDIRYLSDSKHRITVLELLLEAPRTQTDLRESAESSSATVSRLLRSFEEQEWVLKQNGRYELTPIGRFVATEFIALHDRMQATARLKGIVEWLPADLVDLGLECLLDAKLTFPSSTNPLAPPERASELKRHSSRSRGLSHYLPTICIAAHHAAIEEEIQTLEAVFTRELFETIASSASVEAQQFQDVLNSDRATLYVYDGEIPYILGINDDVVYLGIDNDMGVQVALVETSDPRVFAWAEEVFETYRSTALEIDNDESRTLEAAEG